MRLGCTSTRKLKYRGTMEESRDEKEGSTYSTRTVPVATEELPEPSGSIP